MGMLAFSQDADHAPFYIGITVHKERRNANQPSLDLLIRDIRR